MPTTREQLQNWLAEPEGTHLEFKEAKHHYQFDKLVEYCVALANEGGGKFILGVTDRRSRIVGTTAFADRAAPRQVCTSGWRIAFRWRNCARPTAGCWWCMSRRGCRARPGRSTRYLKRAGDELAALTDAELRAMFAETGPDFSAKSIVSPAPSMERLCRRRRSGRFARSGLRKARDERKARWTTEQTLANAELLVDGRITCAALILFGTRAALGRWLAQAELVFEYRSSEASGPAADREEFREGFFLWHDAIWNKINLRNDRQSYQDGLFRIELPTFDEVSVRESLLNAVTHRDYRLGGSVFVRQYSQRLEAVSPAACRQALLPRTSLTSKTRATGAWLKRWRSAG